jgi:hypothetical protein
MVFTVLIGGVTAFFIKKNNVFLKSFSVALLVFLIVFLLYKSRVVYMEDVIAGLGLPSMLSFILFPLFSALNVAILFFMGYTLGKLFSKKTPQVVPQEI